MRCQQFPRLVLACLCISSCLFSLRIASGWRGAPRDDAAGPVRRYGNRRKSGSSFSWVALEDLADALVFIMGRQYISGPVNVTAPERTTNRDSPQGSRGTFPHPSVHPCSGRRSAVADGEASQVITGGQCAVPETLMREGFTFQYPDIHFFNKAFSVKS